MKISYFHIKNCSFKIMILILKFIEIICECFRNNFLISLILNVFFAVEVGKLFFYDRLVFGICLLISFLSISLSLNPSHNDIITR